MVQFAFSRFLLCLRPFLWLPSSSIPDFPVFLNIFITLYIYYLYFFYACSFVAFLVKALPPNFVPSPRASAV